MMLEVALGVSLWIVGQQGGAISQVAESVQPWTPEDLIWVDEIAVPCTWPAHPDWPYLHDCHYIAGPSCGWYYVLEVNGLFYAICEPCIQEYDCTLFFDGFESGDTSAWSRHTALLLFGDGFETGDLRRWSAAKE